MFTIKAKLRKLLGCILTCSVIFVFGAFDAYGEITSRLFVYNSAHDVLYGRTQEKISFSDLKDYLRQYPTDFKLIGIGLGSDPQRLGNYILTGTTRSPLQYWADPTPPYQIREAPEIHSSFLALAVVSPTAVFKRVIKRAPNFLTLFADQMEKLKHVDLAVIRVVGKFKFVRSGITQMIVLSGQTGPVRKEIVLEQPEDSKWEMVGLYARNQSLQLQVSSPGYPVHLHGLEQGAKRGGHIISASVEEADVYIYPIREYELYQNDLTIAGNRRGGKIKVALENLGKLEVSRVEIKMEVPDTTISFSKTVPSLRAGQRVVVEFKETAETATNLLRIQVDPQNLISESREDNNMIRLAPVRKKISRFE